MNERGGPAQPWRPPYHEMSLDQYFHQEYRRWRSTMHPALWGLEQHVWPTILRGLGERSLGHIDGDCVTRFVDRLVSVRGRAWGPKDEVDGEVREALHTLLERAYRLRHIEVMPDLGLVDTATPPTAPPRAVAPLPAEFGAFDSFDDEAPTRADRITSLSVLQTTETGVHVEFRTLMGEVRAAWVPPTRVVWWTRGPGWCWATCSTSAGRRWRPSWGSRLATCTST